MTKSTPNTKASLSAIIGLVAAALIVGAISFGPAFGDSLQGQDLATSSQARDGFVVAVASSKANTKALTKTPTNTTNVAVVSAITSQPAASETAGNYAVAAAGEPYDEDTDENENYESEED